MGVLRNIAGLFRINTRNWKAILLCFFAGIVFWLFNALNKNYTTNISIPVEIAFDEEHFVAVEPLPAEVRINLTGVGWAIFRRSIGLNLPPLSITLEQPHLVRKIVGSSLPGVFSSQLNDLQINYIITDTLYLHIERIVEKKLRLLVHADSLNIKEGHKLISEISITPEQVNIVGPQNMINELGGAIQLDIQKKNIDRDFNERISISRNINSQLKANPEYAQVSFEVIEFVDLDLTLTLNWQNLPTRLRALQATDEVEARFNLRKDKVDEFRENPPQALIDYRNVKANQQKIVPQISTLPAYARLVQADSVSLKINLP
ncbi:MAG TPA: hypothetical protein PKC24_01005 [Cyclobacteriaceae bacterium]|nr:hypothetical protein [Cyclobacteriaceae bacterium]